MIRKSYWFGNPSTEHFVTPYFEALFFFQPCCVVAIEILNRCALSVNSFNLTQGVGFTFMAIVRFKSLYPAELKDVQIRSLETAVKLHTPL